MSLLVCVLFAAVGMALADKCLPVSTINVGFRNVFCDQPLFYNLLPKTEENMLLDNVCATVFPLPDDPSTFHLYTASVYCDGSSEIVSSIVTDISAGVYRKANPYSTMTASVFGYAGCDTYLVYTCTNYGDSDPENFVFSVSTECRPVGLSCMRKIQEIIQSQNLPELDLYVLPMKLPNKCVTQQLCVQPPNPFFNKLPPAVLNYYYY